MKLRGLRDTDHLSYREKNIYFHDIFVVDGFFFITIMFYVIIYVHLNLTFGNNLNNSSYYIINYELLIILNIVPTPYFYDNITKLIILFL